MDSGEGLQQSSSKKRKSAVNRNFLVMIAVLAAVLLAILFAYNQGKQAGTKNGEAAYKEKITKQANDRLLTLPAAGEVTEVSSSKVSIKLTGKESRTAIINRDTQITKSNKPAQVKDIKKGDRVVLFTKKDGNDVIATKVMVR